MSYKRINTTIPMLDFFVSLAFTVFILLVVVINLINPIAKKNDISAKADVMITMDWPDDSNYDVDLHLRTPNNINVYFKTKDVGYVVLDRDDLGKTNDTYQTPDGISHQVLSNREIMTLRSPIEGEYTLAVHLYNTQEDEIVEKIPVTVEIIELNPYKLLLQKTVLLERKNDEKHIANLIIGDLKVKNINFDNKIIVGNISGLWRQ
jgi:hypothetical protein